MADGHAPRWIPWPWSEFRRLRTDLRGTRLSCSANAKKVNRLSARIVKLDTAIRKHREQERHDQDYIDALEKRLENASIQAARQEIRV